VLQNCFAGENFLKKVFPRTPFQKLPAELFLSLTIKAIPNFFEVISKVNYMASQRAVNDSLKLLSA